MLSPINLIKRTALLAVSIILISSAVYSQDDLKMAEDNNYASDKPAGTKTEDGIIYGNDYDPTMEVVAFADLISNPSDNNGKTVLVTGKVAEVCQEMGCWMIMSDGTNTARVLTDHKFFLPKDVAGNNAVVIGTFKVTEIPEGEARHYNEESKDPTVKTEDINGPQKAFIIEATGIKILNQASDSNQD